MVTMASAIGARALAMVVNNHHLTGQGWALALTGPHRKLGGALVCVSDCLGLLLVVTLINACWWV
jgi:hypothetical protein